MDENLRKQFGQLAIDSNNKAWNLLSRNTLSNLEISQMLEYAYTSLSLWSLVGKDIHIARGHWLISRAQSVALNKDLCAVHAKKCSEFTEKAIEGRQHFDFFYASEALARSFALLGEHDEALKFIGKCKNIINEISDKETRDLCISDLSSGPWFDLNFNL